MKEFIESDRYGHRVEFDPDTMELVVSALVREPCPLEWGVLVGEILHNLRSALDHLVWELVILETGEAPKPRKPGSTTKTGFPIFETPGGYDGDRGERLMLHGVGAPARALIRSEQPFHTGEDVASPLWHLHVLSNFDKHRTLHVTGASLHRLQLIYPPMPPDVRIKIRILESPEPGPIEHGTVLHRALLSTTRHPLPPGERKVKVNNFELGVAFDRASPEVAGSAVIPVLGAIGVRVDKILKRAATEIFGTTFEW
jgi:hypothetical protein